jgi:hypothetical protein
MRVVILRESSATETNPAAPLGFVVISRLGVSHFRRAESRYAGGLSGLIRRHSFQIARQLLTTQVRACSRSLPTVIRESAQRACVVCQGIQFGPMPAKSVLCFPL